MPVEKSPSQSAPATFIGIQDGFGSLPEEELYNLRAPVGEHPVGSTVSRSTLEKHGFQIFPGSPER
ncbi:MAG: hypothetical protein PSV13_04445 [Lacunisphaera sp.]|nr:hypothetical protein [Lacunisphaera sp.]